MSRHILYLLAALAPLPALGESCPSTLPQDSLTVRAPAGWRGHSPEDMKLTGFGLMGGEPQSMSYLKPESSSKTKTGGKIIWWHGGELWLYCTYDDSGAIQISKPLIVGGKCTANYTKKDGVITEMKVECS